MLKLNDVETFYGPIQALKKVSLTVGEGEIVSLLGGNACGKSTTMKTILGLVRPRSGTVEFSGRRIDRRPYRPGPGAVVHQSEVQDAGHLAVFVRRAAAVPEGGYL